jgi:hypothetical protein
MSLGEYLRAIVRRAAAERRPDDDLDGCELDFRHLDFLTRDDEIERLLIPLPDDFEWENGGGRAL